MSQDRDTFRQLAELRLTEAKLLYANGLASGAYYLAGYAVESVLKESWATISKWSEHARYEVWTSDAATTMLEAVGADKGLLQWLLKR